MPVVVEAGTADPRTMKPTSAGTARSLMANPAKLTRVLLFIASLNLSMAVPVLAQDQDAGPPMTALPSLNVPAYMGTWYQVAWFPNRFQQQCVSDTRATYRALPADEIEVTNQCRNADGSIETVVGLARPTHDASVRDQQLEPAKLEVSFMPRFLRWLPLWGNYWVIDLAADGRYALVSEPKRQYLWVLSRSPTLSDEDQSAIRSRLQSLGFDLSRWQLHSQTHPPTHSPAPHVAPAPTAPR